MTDTLHNRVATCVAVICEGLVQGYRGHLWCGLSLCVICLGTVYDSKLSLEVGNLRSHVLRTWVERVQHWSCISPIVSHLYSDACQFTQLYQINNVWKQWKVL